MRSKLKILVFLVTTLGVPTLHAQSGVSTDTKGTLAPVEATPNQLLRQGIAAYKKRDYVKARESFALAFQKEPLASVAATLADVEMKLKRFRDAAEHWNIYLKSLGPDQATERAEVLAQLEDCRKHVGTATVHVEPKESQVIVDGVAVDVRATGGDVWLEPGSHTLEVKVDDRTSEPKTVAINPGDQVDVTLVAPPPPAPRATHEPPPSPKPFLAAVPDKPLMSTRTAVVLSGALLTITGVTVGVIYWQKNRSAKRDLDAAVVEVVAQTSEPDLIAKDAMCSVDDPPAGCKRIRTAVKAIDRTANISNASLIAAGVLGVATIGAYLLWPSHREESIERMGLTVAPWWSSSSQGVTAQFGF
jgi:archaellum component FlaG (FlaF/FlaG flagellin family)